MRPEPRCRSSSTHRPAPRSHTLCSGTAARRTRPPTPASPLPQELPMSDSTKVIVPPDEAEADATDTALPVVGAGAEPGPETRGAFGGEEPSSVGEDEHRGATAGQTDVAAADEATATAA